MSRVLGEIVIQVNNCSKGLIVLRFWKITLLRVTMAIFWTNENINFLSLQYREILKLQWEKPSRKIYNNCKKNDKTYKFFCKWP